MASSDPATRRQGKKSRAIHFPRTTNGAADDPDAWIVPEADRNANVIGIVVPGPATKNSRLPAGGTSRIALRAGGIIVLPIPVVHPFPNVTEQIIKAESVGALVGHFMRLFAAVV
jgi:hypothetical protein